MKSPPTQDELTRWDRQFVWHAFSQMADYQGLIIESGQGCWIQDIHGQRYLDGVSNLWCNLHGHRHPAIDAAIIEQLHQVAHVTQLGLSHPTTIRLAQRLASFAPDGLQHVFFSSDGASAVEVALKMAVQYWQQCASPEPNRDLFVAVGGAYHGDTIGCVSLSHIPLFQTPFQKLLFEVIHGPQPDQYRLPPGITQEQACAHYLAQYRSILEREAGRVAALIVEPIVQGAAGMIVQPAGFLKGLRQLTHEFDVLLIADEIAVGMGRTGKLFACEHESVTPDLLCLGKGLTGGYLPMAATLTSNRIWEAFLGEHATARTFFHGHTYGGNPLAAAAALATLDLFETEKTLDHVQAMSRILHVALQPLSNLPHVGDIRQRGLMAAIELVQDKVTRTAFPAHERRGWKVCQACLRHGVWLRPLGDNIVIVPPLSIQENEIHQIVHAIHESIASISR